MSFKIKILFNFRLTFVAYSSASSRPSANDMTRFLPITKVESLFHDSRTCLKWMFLMLSMENTNNLGYSSTHCRILSTILWNHTNIRWKVRDRRLVSRDLKAANETSIQMKTTSNKQPYSDLVALWEVWRARPRRSHRGHPRTNSIRPDCERPSN